MSEIKLKKGYYYSKENTDELWIIDEQSKVWIVPITLLEYPALLDYPEVKNVGSGSIAYGDYGPAHKELQQSLNDLKLSTVGND